MQRKLERLEAERQKLLDEQQAWSAEKVEAAQQLAAMDAKLADALRRNNAEWRARMDGRSGRRPTPRLVSHLGG